MRMRVSLSYDAPFIVNYSKALPVPWGTGINERQRDASLQPAVHGHRLWLPAGAGHPVGSRLLGARLLQRGDRARRTYGALCFLIAVFFVFYL